MSAANVVRSMFLMQDAELASEVAGGDLSGMEQLSFTDEELELVLAVAAQLSAEVAAFSATSAALAALRYVGEQGIPKHLESELDEVVGFVFATSPIGSTKAATCMSTCAECKGCGKRVQATQPGMINFTVTSAGSTPTPGG